VLRAVVGTGARGVRLSSVALPVGSEVAVWDLVANDVVGSPPYWASARPSRVRLIDRLALAADHLLYGLVLSATRLTQPKLTAKPVRVPRLAQGGE